MSFNSRASTLEILPYKIKYSWKKDWSTIILEELKKVEYREGEQALLLKEIDEEDLDDLECDGYNKASLEEKSDFWIVFFSALARAESGFNEKAKSKMSKGHRSYGLLQLAPQTAKNQCGVKPPEQNVLNAQDNLICGVKLLSWQLNGAPISKKENSKKLRPDLEGQLFGKKMFQWGPLRKNDKNGKKLLVNWFKKHADQLNFCHINR